MRQDLPAIGGGLATELAAIAVGAVRTVGNALDSLAAEARDLRFTGPRARLASMAAIAVVLSAAVACAMHLPHVWWAAISGFVSTQATRPGSLHKAVLRILGTAAGAALGLATVGWLAYDPLACCLALLAVSAVGILGVLVSPHGYAWLFFGITFSLVVLMSLDAPLDGFGIAVYRMLEVVVGTAVAMLTTTALAPEGGDTAPAPPGWTDLLGAQWPAVLHALRSGIAVAALPLVWSWFHLPGLTAMAMTLATVLAVPVLADHPMDQGPQIVEKATQRVLGCGIGGVLALALLALPLDSLLPWLVALFGGVWLFAHLQSSRRGVGYIGVQAAVAFIIVLVQGEGPPASMIPALNRFAGIVLGLLTLLFVCILVQPGDGAPQDAGEGLTTRAEPT